MADITYEQLFDTLRREKSRDELQKLEKNFYDQVRIFLSIKEDMIRAESVQGINSLAAQRAQIEFQNVKKILKELYERRERKIITMALHRTRTEAAIIDNDTLLAEEKLFLESMVHLMLQTREQILSVVENRMPVIVTPGPQYEARVFAAPQPTSYDQDMKYTIREKEPEYEEEAPKEQPAPARAEEERGDTFTTVETNIKVMFLAPVPKFVGKDLRVFGPYEQGASAELPDDIAQILIRKGRAQEVDP
jgi:DNA replication initiation complex subunit (GINS family)